MYFLYSLLTAAGMLLLLPYWIVQGLRHNKYWSSIGQRLGFLPESLNATRESGNGSIWIHAVSVGEVLAALPLAQQLKLRFPDQHLVLSTTTATGQRIAQERAGFADAVFYFPLDWRGPVRRALRAVRPAVVVILETEIWPNFLREMRRADVPVAFVNGRISERSFRRYRWLDGFLVRVLQDPQLFLMQSEEDARRLRALGAPEDRVRVTGNVKYDLAPPASNPLADWLEAQLRSQERWPVVMAGSIAADEEESVLAAYDIVQRRWRRALLVLAPRKPARFDAAAHIAGEAGWRVVRRSSLRLDAPLDEAADVILLDTVGELAALYRLADAVFVGGSLVPVGGHNLLEPAWFARPPVFGPHMSNFREMAAEFRSADAGAEVQSGEELGKFWCKLIENPERARRMGEAARSLVERNRGATQRSFDQIAALLGSGRGQAAAPKAGLA